MFKNKGFQIVLALVLVSVATLSITGHVFARFMPPTLKPVASISREVHEQYQWAVSQMQTEQDAAARENAMKEASTASSSAYSAADIHAQYQWALVQTVPATTLLPAVNDGVRFEQYLAALDQMEAARSAALYETNSTAKLAVLLPTFSDGDRFGQYLWVLEQMEIARQAEFSGQ